MPIGPRMSAAERYLITKEALRNRNEPRRVVAARLQRLIEDELLEAAPTVDTLLKMVSHARNHAPDESDQPWSMGCLNHPDCKIATLTVPTVLQTWRYAVATHESFTVRQAKWASHLHGLFTEPALTWWWSLRYAFAEKASSIANVAFQTTALDAQLVMAPTELEATTHTGATEQSPLAWGFTRYFPEASDGSPLYELLHLPEFAVPPIPLDDLLADDDARLTQVDRRLQELPPLDSLGLSIEKKLEYLHWLTYMYTGPLWSALTPDEVLGIVVELRRRAITSNARSTDGQLEQSQLFIRPWRSIPVYDLLQRVGLQPQDSMTQGVQK